MYGHQERPPVLPYGTRALLMPPVTWPAAEVVRTVLRLAPADGIV